LKRKDKFTRKQTFHLERLCRINEPICKAMLLKESFLEVYDYNKPARAEKYFRGLIKDALASSFDVFKKITESFLEKTVYYQLVQKENQLGYIGRYQQQNQTS